VSKDKKKKRRDYEPGDRVHDWVLIERLGSGGSAEAWSAEDRDGEMIALKILVTKELSKIIRFVREVELMDSIRERISVPIYDVYLPGCSEPPACYTMPIGTSLRDYMEQQYVDALERVEVLARVGDCLHELHKRDLFHCDVKPGNIYNLADRWVFGDFGLAIRSNQRLLAGPDELPGTREYTAPELFERHLPNDTDWAKCDSFSFGKTIWTVMAAKRRPPPGPHRRGDAETMLKSVVGSRPGVKELDRLIRTATAGRPEDRPTVEEITARLREWHDQFSPVLEQYLAPVRANMVPALAAE